MKRSMSIISILGVIALVGISTGMAVAQSDGPDQPRRGRPPIHVAPGQPGQPGAPGRPGAPGSWVKGPPLTGTPSTSVITLTGRLLVVNGQISIQQNNVTYFVRGINQLVGFVDGLKEGAVVTIAGVDTPLKSPEFHFLRALKLTVNGKDYDLAPAKPARPARPDTPVRPAVPPKPRGK